LGQVSPPQSGGEGAYVLDSNRNISLFIPITDSKVHETNILDEFLPETGAFCVTDRGYIDFERLFVFTLCSAFFVIRIKTSCFLATETQSPVSGDEIGNVGPSAGGLPLRAITCGGATKALTIGYVASSSLLDIAKLKSKETIVIAVILRLDVVFVSRRGSAGSVAVSRGLGEFSFES
jgi:hypothetical protein